MNGKTRSLSKAETEIVRAWRKAADDLGIRVLTDGIGADTSGHPIRYLAQLPDFGSRAGMVCGYVSAPEEELTQFARWAKSVGIYRSLLSDSYRHYDRDLFIETLDDWGWWGASDPPELVSRAFPGSNRPAGTGPASAPLAWGR